MKIKGAFPVRWAAQNGIDGKGVTIVKTEIKYAVSTSGTTKPSIGWQTTIPSVSDGNYLWTWTHVEYSDGTKTDAYTTARQGVDGKGIKSSQVTYSLQESNVNPESITNWGSFPSELTDGYWLYTRTVITYSEGDTTTSYSVSQVGVGSYYAGVEEYYKAGESNTLVPDGAATQGTYVSGETISTSWRQDRPTLKASTPYLWNFEISSDSRGNRYVTAPRCIGNFAKGIVSIVETYAISAQGGVPQGMNYPNDIEEGDWTDEHFNAEPTNEKPYQWNKTVTTYNDGTKDTIYHVSAVKGADGKGSTYIDLDNENDSMLYDGSGNLIGGNSGWVTSNISLYSNGQKITSKLPTFSIKERSASITYYNAFISGQVLTVKGLTGDSGWVVVKCTYNNVEYTAKMTIKRLVGVDKYELQLNHNAVSYNTTTGALSNTDIAVEVYRTAQNGSRTKVTTMATYTLTAKLYPNGASTNSRNITFNSSGNGTASITAEEAAAWTNFAIVLFKNGSEVDRETIPINKAQNGGQGHAAKAIYRLSFAQPSTPSGANPQGTGALAWHDDPYVQDEVKITQQGDWYLDSDGFMRAPTIGRYERSVQTLSFVTTADNQKIYLRLKCTTGSGSYVRIGVLDNVTPESSYQISVSGSNQDTGDIEVNVPKAGVHFICIYYYRDYYNDSYVKFACGKMSVWQSNVKSYNSDGVITEWITPFKVGSDSENTEVQTRANLLKQTAFLASMMDAWEVANGSTTEGLDGRNGYQVNHNTSSENIMDVLRQIIYDPNGDKQLLPDTWYTLSFWVKLRSYNSSYSTKLITYIYPMCVTSQQGDLCAVEVTAGRIIDGRAYGNTTPTDCYYEWDVTQQWVRHSITFKTRKNGIPSEKQAVLFRLPVSSNGIVICMPKLEQGTVATAYVTNDKDMADWAAEETGFPNDRGIWVESPSENYVWNDDHRDYVASAVSGEWKRYFVKKKGMTVPNGTGPTDGGNTYWEEGSRISTLLVNTIVGSNASLTFAKSNRLLITNSSGTVSAGLGGAENGDTDIPFWIGKDYANRATAPFRVNLKGEFWANNAHINGDLTAQSGDTVVRISTQASEEGMTISRSGVNGTTKFIGSERAKADLFTGTGTTETIGAYIANESKSYYYADLEEIFNPEIGTQPLSFQFYGNKQDSAAFSVDLLDTSVATREFHVDKPSFVSIEPQNGDCVLQTTLYTESNKKYLDDTLLYSNIRLYLTYNVTEDGETYEETIDLAEQNISVSSGNADKYLGKNVQLKWSGIKLYLMAGTYTLHCDSRIEGYIDREDFIAGSITSVAISNAMYKLNVVKDPVYYRSLFFGNGFSLGSSELHHFQAISADSVMDIEAISGNSGWRVCDGLLYVRLGGVWYLCTRNNSGLMYLSKVN